MILWIFVVRIAEAVYAGGDVRDAFCGPNAQNTISASKVNLDVIHDEDRDVTTERQRVNKIDAYSTRPDVIIYFLFFFSVFHSICNIIYFLKSQ